MSFEWKKVDLSGLDPLADRLEAEVLHRLAVLAHETVVDAQTRCPVKTGTLRASINWGVAGDVPAGTLGVQIVAAAPYAGFVDLGTRYQPGHPYFTPALDQAREKLADVGTAALRAAAGEA